MVEALGKVIINVQFMHIEVQGCTMRAETEREGRGRLKSAIQHNFWLIPKMGMMYVMDAKKKLSQSQATLKVL